MNLTKAESEVFWPLYREFQMELQKINDQRVNLIMDYAKNYERLSDDKADSIIKEYMDFQNAQLKLKKQYLKKFNKILPSKKVARFYQLENKIDAVINYELAAEIPLVK